MAKLFSHIQFHSLVISYQALGIWEKYIAKVSELPSLLQIRRAWYHTRSASLEPTRYLVYFMCSFEHRPRLILMIPILIKLMSCYELWIISDTFPIFFYYSVHFFFFELLASLAAAACPAEVSHFIRFRKWNLSIHTTNGSSAAAVEQQQHEVSIKARLRRGRNGPKRQWTERIRVLRVQERRVEHD